LANDDIIRAGETRRVVPMKIRIGSRGSLLALWQAEHVKARLQALGHDVAIQVITTTGDRIQDRRLEAVGGKGAFLKEIEEALLARVVDLAVHSLKDVPTALPEGLHLVAVLERADPRDAFLSHGPGLRELPPGSRVGTTSLRRQAVLREVRPDLVLSDLRGNVDTRLGRLREGGFDAILLAMAGLVRLGRVAEVTEALDPLVFVPAPGQGAIALEGREEDRALAEAVAPLDHPLTASSVAAERAFLKALGGGCNVPLGAFAQPDPAGLKLVAFVSRPDGGGMMRGERAGPEAEALGQTLGEDFVRRGAASFPGR
jgi:hydroxymethylbilane synthase